MFAETDFGFVAGQKDFEGFGTRTAHDGLNQFTL